MINKIKTIISKIIVVLRYTKIKQILYYVFRSLELSNFTYKIKNINEIIHLINLLTGCEHKLIFKLLNEIDLSDKKMKQFFSNKFFENYENLTPIKQNGESTFYKKRRLGDSYIDINTSIKDNFDLFRISDNVLYPVRFKYLDNEYVIKIYKA